MRLSVIQTSVTLAALLGVSGCELVDRIVRGTPEARLVEAELAAWAAPGGPLLEGLAGRDTVGAVTETAPDVWEVTLPDAGETWRLELTHSAVYAVHDGAAFGRWLQERVRELGMRAFLPPDAMSQVASGSVVAVGDVSIRYGRTDRSGSNTEERVVFEYAGPDGAPASRVEPTARSRIVLRDALVLVYDDMIQRDERVHSCMGSLTAASVPRPTQLACVRRVLEEEFGEQP